MAGWLTWETIGAENTRRAPPPHLGQGIESGAVPMGRPTSVGPSCSQVNW